MQHFRPQFKKDNESTEDVRLTFAEEKIKNKIFFLFCKTKLKTKTVF